MNLNKINIGNLFLVTAIIMLLVGLCFGILAAFTYLYPNFLKENIDLLTKLPESENFMLGISNYGPPEVILSRGNSIDVIHSYMSCRENLFYGPLWKHYCRTGEIKKLIYAIQNKNVVVVGLKHLSDLSICWSLKNFHHLKIRIPSATKERFEILDKLKEYTNSIILFQCGDMFALWFIKNLQNSGNTLIDMGRCLDLFCTMNDIDQEVMNIFPDLRCQTWINDFLMQNIKSFEKIIVVSEKKFITEDKIRRLLSLNGLDKLDILFNVEYNQVCYPMTCVLFINTKPSGDVKMPCFFLDFFKMAKFL
jgi:hypothetical protein